MKKSTRLLSLLLCLAMVFSMIPAIALQASAAEADYNALTNGSFEDSTVGYATIPNGGYTQYSFNQRHFTAVVDSTWTDSPYAGVSSEGVRAVRIGYNGADAATATSGIWTPFVDVVPGETVTFTMDVYPMQANALQIHAYWFAEDAEKPSQPSEQYLFGGQVRNVTVDEWQTVSYEAVIPEGAAKMAIAMYGGTGWGATIDNAVLTVPSFTAAIDGAAADAEAAAAVVDQIAAIGEVTLNNQTAVKEAKAAYDALTDAQKALVSNAAVLDEAVAARAELLKAQDQTYNALPNGSFESGNVGYAQIPTDYTVHSKGDFVRTVDSAWSTTDPNYAPSTDGVRAVKIGYAGDTINDSGYAGIWTSFVDVVPGETVTFSLDAYRLQQDKASVQVHGYWFAEDAEAPSQIGDQHLFGGNISGDVNAWNTDTSYEAVIPEGAAKIAIAIYAPAGWAAIIDNLVLTVPSYSAAVDEEANAAAAVAAVKEQIAAIGEVTLNNQTAVKEAKAAYDALTDEQKALVDNAAVLDEAVAARAELLKAQDQTYNALPNGSFENGEVGYAMIPTDWSEHSQKDFVRTVDSAWPTSSDSYGPSTDGVRAVKINNTSEGYSGIWSSFVDVVPGETVTFTLDAYRLNTTTASAQVYAYWFTDDVEAPTQQAGTVLFGGAVSGNVGEWNTDISYSEVVPEGAAKIAILIMTPKGWAAIVDNAFLTVPSYTASKDGAAAEAVVALIDAIGTVTAESGTAITQARAAYDKLSDAQKALVTNLATLEAAEEAFANLGAEIPEVEEIPDILNGSFEYGWYNDAVPAGWTADSNFWAFTRVDDASDGNYAIMIDPRLDPVTGEVNGAAMWSSFLEVTAGETIVASVDVKTIEGAAQALLYFFDDTMDAPSQSVNVPYAEGQPFVNIAVGEKSYTDYITYTKEVTVPAGATKAAIILTCAGSASAPRAGYYDNISLRAKTDDVGGGSGSVTVGYGYDVENGSFENGTYVHTEGAYSLPKGWTPYVANKSWLTDVVSSTYEDTSDLTKYGPASDGTHAAFVNAGKEGADGATGLWSSFVEAVPGEYMTVSFDVMGVLGGTNANVYFFTDDVAVPTIGAATSVVGVYNSVAGDEGYATKVNTDIQVPAGVTKAAILLLAGNVNRSAYYDNVSLHMSEEIFNGDFEGGFDNTSYLPDGWTHWSGTASERSLVAGNGGGSALSLGTARVFSSAFNITGSEVFNVTYDVNVVSGLSQVIVYFYNAEGQVDTKALANYGYMVQPGVWTTMNFSITAPEGATYAKVALVGNAYFDNIIVARANYIVNADFEGGYNAQTNLPTGWTNWMVGQNASLSVVTEGSNTYVKAAAGASAGIISSAYEATPGQTYTVSVKGKGGEGSKGYVLVRYFNGAEPATGTLSNGTVYQLPDINTTPVDASNNAAMTSADWQIMSTSFKVPAGVDNFRVVLYTNGSSTDTYFDDVTVALSTGEVNVLIAEAIAAIDNIPDPVTVDSRYYIDLARAKYNVVPMGRQSEVTNRDVLFAAENTLAALQAEQDAVDAAAANNVESLIDAIGDVTLESREAIETAENAYDELTRVQKQQVENYETLVLARMAYDELEKDAIAETIALIEAIGEVTADSEAAIVAAEEAYNALTAEQQAQVTNAADLFAARAAYDELVGGEVEPEGPEYVSTLNPMSAPGLSLNNGVAAQCLLSKTEADKYDRVYMEFVSGDATIVAEAKPMPGYENWYVYFEFGMFAFQMTQAVDYTMYAEKDGQVYRGDTVEGWTIKSQAISLLDRNYANYNSNANAKAACDLVIAMLAYGEQAQVKFPNEYTTEMPTDGLDAKYLDLIPTGDPVLGNAPTFSDNGYEIPFISVGLELESVIMLSFALSMNGKNSADYRGVATLDGKDYDLELIPMAGYEKWYASVTFEDVRPDQMREPVTVKIMKGDEVVSNIHTMSLIDVATGKLSAYPDLIPAMIRYADAAAVYFELNPIA